MTDKDDDFELIRGSGNVFKDFGDPDADILQLKSKLAAEIIGVLDGRGLSVRKAQELTGFSAADFSRIRNVRLDRFTIDRLMAILNKLDQKVEVSVTVSATKPAQEANAHAM
jgi:predicted XRE-type DNA-binding protein